MAAAPCELFTVAVDTAVSESRTKGVTHEDMSSDFRGRSTEQHSSACAGGGGCRGESRVTFTHSHRHLYI